MIIMYSTHCPLCRVLERKLIEKNIDFDEITDEDTIIARGIKNVPMLDINGQLFTFAESIRWVDSQ